MYKRIARVTIASIKQIVFGIPFWLSVFMCFLILTSEGFTGIIKMIGQKSSSLFPTQENAYIFGASFQFGYIMYAAPLLCAFSCAHIFPNNFAAGYYRMQITRVGKDAYRYGMWLGTTICGGLSLALGIVLYASFLSIISLPHDPSIELSLAPAWQALLRFPGGWPFMLAQAGLGFLFGWVWSGVGLLSSFLTPNRYVACFSPFIIVFSIDLLLKITPFSALSPMEALIQINLRDFSFINIILYEIFVYLIIFLCYEKASKWRLSYG